MSFTPSYLPTKVGAGRGSPRGASGWALVMVLGSLLLLSLLVLAFFSSTSKNTVSSSAYVRGEEVRVLAESVTNLLIGQIREATSAPDTAWISQPGLIRTFTSGGEPGRAFKLYSASEMILEDGLDPAADLTDDLPADWSAQPDVFCDLNEPVEWNGAYRYPIVNPTADGTVEGFHNGSQEAGMASGANELPLPVRWLYMLEDGTLHPAGAGGRVAAASRSNPIIARVAFWTDDETCKLNLNIASSGLFWDTPRGPGNDSEKGEFASGSVGSHPVVTVSGLAASPPGPKEYNRYPGHPATTSLDVVLSNTFFFPGLESDFERHQRILALTPRVAFGGSRLGTAFPDATAVALDEDRLYASVDEYLYATDRSLNQSSEGEGTVDGITPERLDTARFFLTTHNPSPDTTLFNTPRVTIWPMPLDEDARTPFEKVMALCSRVDGREYLFTRGAFADGAANLHLTGSVTGGFAWFEGANTIPALSQTRDFNAANKGIYDYLYGLMQKPIPGYGASLKSKFDADTGEILTLIYDYIRSTNLYDLSAPNARPFTARPFTFNECRRLGLTGNRPYTASLRFADLPPPAAEAETDADGYVTSAFVGQVVPIRIDAPDGPTRGAGRFPVITGATLVIIATDPEDLSQKYEDPDAGTLVRRPHVPVQHTFASFADAAAADLPEISPEEYTAPAYKAAAIQAGLLFQVATPSAGPLEHAFTYEVEVTGLDQATLNGQPAGFADLASNRVFSSSAFTRYRNRIWGRGTPNWVDSFFAPVLRDSAGMLYDLQGSGHKQDLTPSSGENTGAYPFVGGVVPLDGADHVRFNGVVLSVSLKVDGQTVQTYEIELPDFDAPAPRWSPLGFKAEGKEDVYYCDSWKDRLYSAYLNPGYYGYISSLDNNVRLPALVLPYNLDTVRGVELVHGDTRLIAGRASSTSPDVPKSLYRPCDGYDQVNRYHAHNLWRHPKAQFGRLVASPDPSGDVLPNLALPSRLVAATRSDGHPGDWDAGVPYYDVYNDGAMDIGPYINKTDDAAAYWLGNHGRPALPYYGTNSFRVTTSNAFSPSRILPSAGMFGSLPVGVKRGLPWQTLLFRPGFTTHADPLHPGADGLPDHLILDLFTLPVVEPYPISEPFASSGRVNLNTQIIPFTYLKRDTALRGVLHAVRIFANASSNAYLNVYDPGGSSASNATTRRASYRYPINRDATMKLIHQRLEENRPFLSPSEICGMFLVPLPENRAAASAIGSTGVNLPPAVTAFQTALSPDATAQEVEAYVKSFWNTAGNATPDNLRERPYATILPRVTTRSNTFTVYCRIQRLRKGTAADADRFDSSGGDKVLAEYRGSVSLERFLDPNHATFDPDLSDAALGPYRFRVTNQKQFP